MEIEENKGIVSFMKAEYKEKHKLNINTLKEFFNRLKEATSNETIELSNGFSFILEILLSENSNQNKKELIEVLKFCYGIKTTIHVFNRNTDLIRQMCNCIRELNESQGLKLMKTFNCFIVNNLFSERTNGFNQATFEVIIKEYFYKFILTKINDFTKFPDNLKNNQEKYKVAYDEKRKKKIKPLKFGNSIIIFDEIFSNLIILLEEIAKLNNKEEIKHLKEKKKAIYKYIKSVCLKYIELMRHKISSIKAYLDETYFKDFLQFYLRALSFFGKLLIKIKENYFKNQSKILELSKEIKEASIVSDEKSSIFVIVITDLVEHIPINMAKLKDECFSNVKNFFTLYPEKMIGNIRKLAQDSFFVNESKLYYNYENVRSTYFSWISSIKFVLKKHSDLILNTFTLDDYYELFENLCGILFDDNNHLNYVLKVLNCMGTLLDFMKKKANNENLHIFLANIIQRLVNYLKNTYSDIEDLIECLKYIKESNEKNCSLKKLSEMSKEEIVEAITKNSNILLEEELINKEKFDLRFNKNILVQNTVIVNFERGNKLIDFLEETVFKRLSTLNDLILRIYQYYLLEYKKHLKVDSPDFDFKLNYPEYGLVQKIFKYNILIIDKLFSNAELFEIDNMPNSIKDIQFKLSKFIHFKEETENYCQQITMQYRQVHKIMTSIVDILIKTFRNIQIKFGKNHQEYYQIIFGSLGCHFSSTNKKIKNITAKEIKNSRFLNKAFFNVIINRIIDLMQKTKFEYFDPFYEKDKANEDRKYLLTILKGIYRTIKYKYKFHLERFKNQNLVELKKIFILDVKEVTLKLILVFIQKTYEKEEIFDYLYVLKIIFKSTLKTKEFLTEFVAFVQKYDVRIFEFLKSLYLSNYPELKTIAIDFLNELPIDPKLIIKDQYPNIQDLSWFIDLLIDAMDSSDSSISNRSIQVLFELFKFYEKKDVEKVMTIKIKKIYNETKNIIGKWHYKLELFYKKNPNHDYFIKLKNILKFLGKYSECLKNSRNLSIFHFKPFSSSSNYNFKFFDANNNILINDYSIKDFITNTLNELRILKSKPWFHYLEFNSNYTYYHTNEKFIGLDKLFKFLMSVIKQINLSVCDKKTMGMFENILESMYLVTFYLRIFKSCEMDISTTEELEELKNFLNSLLVNEKTQEFALKFFMRNIFNQIKLKSSEMENPLYEFTKSSILKILNLQKRELNAIFLQEMIYMMNSTDFHKLVAVIDIVKNNILKNINDYPNLKNDILKTKKMEILQSLVHISNKLDFKFNISLNKDYLDLFEEFSLWILRESDKSKNEDLCSFYKNFNNFKVNKLFLRKVSFEKILLEKDLINIEFKNWEEYAISNSKFFNSKIEKNMQSLREFWNVEFIEELKCLTSVLNYGLERELKFSFNLENFQEQNLTNLNPILDLCEKIIRENIKYSVECFGKKNMLVEKIYIEKDENEQNKINEPLIDELFYYDYDKKISVDQYDYFVKEFSELLAGLIDFLFEFFEIIFNNETNINEKLPKEILEFIEKKTSKIFTHLLFRLEKKINKAIFPKIKNFVKNSQNTHSEVVKKIFVPLKFIGEKKINEPILYIYFQQLKNFQSQLDLGKIIKIMEQYITDYRCKKIEEDIENNARLLPDFNIIKKFYYIINWIRIIKQSRDILFSELKKAIEIELILDNLEEETQSLYPELLNMMNKQSNSHFFHHIQKELKTDTPEFFLIYDMFKNEKSICMRERVSREDIIDFILKEITNSSEKPKWLLFLYQISKKSKYFILSGKFPLFCSQYHESLCKIERPKMISFYNHFFDRHRLFMKILKNYVEINPFDRCMNLYIHKFLLQKNYCLKREILSVIRNFRSSYEMEKFTLKIKETFGAMSSSTEKNKRIIKTFYLTEVAPRYLDFFKVSSKKYLEEICKAFSERSEDYLKNASIIEIVATIKFMTFLFRRFPKFTNDSKIFKSLFTYSWNNIAHPKDNNEKIKNICILMVSTLMNQYKTDLEIDHHHHVKPLYDNILYETKIFDNESKLIWLESLGLLLKVYQNEQREWFKDVLGAHEFNESSLSSKCWQLTIVLRDFFGHRFFDFFQKKFFEERYRSLHENFDTLLIILTYFINNKNKPEVIEYLTENTKIQILSKLLDIYIKELKESIYEDKYFHLILVYLKYFDIIPPFDLVNKKIMEQQNNDDERYHKFPKIAKQNFILVYYFLKKNINHPDFAEYSTTVLKYIYKHKAVKNLLIHIKYTEIPIIIFNILKICFIKQDNIKNFLKYTNQILYNYTKDSRDMMLGVFVYHFLLENNQHYSKYSIINLENILEYVFAHVQSDKTELVVLKRGDQRHYLKGLFDLKDDLIIPYHYSFISLFKFFSITLIKTWILTFKKEIIAEDFKTICDYFSKVTKFGYENIEMKICILNLVKAMIFHDEIITGWEIYGLENLSENQRTELLLSIQITKKTLIKEYYNKNFKVYLNKYFELILKYLNKYPMNKEIRNFIINTGFRCFLLFENHVKFLLIEKLGYSCKYDFYNVFEFFLNNWKGENNSSLIIHIEGDDIFSLISIYYSNLLFMKSDKIMFCESSNKIASSKTIFEDFLGIVEFVGLNSDFVYEFVLNLFKQKIQESDPEEREQFILKFIDILINSSALGNSDYNKLCRIFITISENFINSSLVAKLITEQENNLDLLRILQNKSSLTDNEIILYQSLFKDNSILKS